MERERFIKPPLEVLKKLIETTIVEHNKDIILFFEIEKCVRPNIGAYYKIHYSLCPEIDFNLFEVNLRILELYRTTYKYLFNFFKINKSEVRVHMGHWLFNIRPLNTSLVLRTAPLI
jgi:hypothetical protein